jgi:hemerythrin superfamily protein
MARAKRKSRARRNGRASQRSRSSRAATDAISLLKADHREVEGLFQQFAKARSDDRKLELAGKICAALKTHTVIEEEIFYPAFLEATEETDIHHEAAVEHNGAKKLIAEIEGSGPQDEYYDAKVTVLSEMIKHHVNEEEKRDGMFAKARQSEMDLQALGEQLASRKAELMAQGQGPAASGRRATRGMMGRMNESMRH